MVREEAKKNPTRAAARMPARYDRRKMVNRSVLSGAHARLGLLISRFMANHQMKSMEFALLVGLTRVNVSEALSGYYDFRLTELESVCRLLGIEAQDIFKGMHNGPIRATAVKHDHRSGDGLPDVLTLQPGQKRHVPSPDPRSGDEAVDAQFPWDPKR
jgi:DNA-binding Xre family transcriptional regulator